MRKMTIIVATLFILAFGVLSPAGAADKPAGGFFGIKKFIKKNSTEEPRKKKTEPVPGNGELTEEENKLVQAMAAKVPGESKRSVRLPASALLSRPPKNPSVSAPTTPGLPKNPNDIVVRIPQPPSKAPQAPVTTGPAQPATNPQNN